MGNTNPTVLARLRRKVAVRKRIEGSTSRPRLSVFRSANHIYAQIVDDVNGRTIVSASTQSPELKGFEGHRGNIKAAVEVGKLLAQKALAANLDKVVFDRNGYLYHGRIKALADAAREGGLNF